MRTPSMARMPAELARASRWIAERLAAAGHRAWLVGGAVRDLALEREPKDADLASAALPEEIERLFPRTHAVGRAFGTVVVPCEGVDVQVTTFRAESGYADARRPSAVRFSTRPEEDAARRDFTCNALYLDPLTDELLDPTGGLADLAAGRLRCVGEAGARFAEDGLRLLRLARLAAHHGLAIEPETLEGARGSLEALRGVSPERVLAELVRMAEGPDPARAVALLLELGALPALPGLGRLESGGLTRRVRAVAGLETGGSARLLALLFLPGAEWDAALAHAALLELRPARALERRVGQVFQLFAVLEGCLAELATAPRARWIRLVRAEEFADALAVHAAWHGERHARERAELVARTRRLGPDELWPAPLVTSAELAKAGIPQGPRWGELLRAAEEAQLEGEFRDAAGARAWLARQVS
ncbi:MAG TPA: CCA tRNA nucleotidyltransferase [Planctomycetota bacterium]